MNHLFFVGNKKDLRDDINTIESLAKNKQEPIELMDGHDMKEEINAFSYIECSAKTGEGVREVFETAQRAAFQKKKKRKKSCKLL